MRPKHLAIFLALLALVTLAMLAVLAAAPAPAHASGVVTVCDEANLKTALAGGGAVTFNCSGTITLTATISVTANTSIDGSGQTVTISGNDAVRVFSVNPGVSCSLNRLSIAKGAVKGDAGAGIFNQGILTVSYSTFQGNSNLFVYGRDAGSNNTDTLTASKSAFDRNSGDGGGIYNDGAVTVSNSTFSENASSYRSSGGGIYNAGTLMVSNSMFDCNNVMYGEGAGIYNAGTLTVNNSTFHGNWAYFGAGGGIYNAGTLTVRNSAFDRNSGDGGGIFNGGALTVGNSTFFSNLSNYRGSGGGIYNAGALTVSNSTFSENASSSFPYADGGDSVLNRGAARLENTIVANGSGSGPNCAGTITDGGGNLSYPDTSCLGINRDPKLGPLEDNGGPTLTMAIGLGSAALDAANDTTCAAPPVNNLDQRGFPRPVGPRCDIGAYELSQATSYMYLPILSHY
jgi:hypothetical protein